MSKRYILGPMLGVGLTRHLAFEFDALYRRIGYITNFNSPFPGYSTTTRERANSWEFPMMLKYRLGDALAQPFVGIGYAPRTVAGVIRIPYSATHGLVVSGGVSVRAGHLRVAPQLRYVHWNAPFLNDTAGSPDVSPPFASKQDELFVLVGVSWQSRQ